MSVATSLLASTALIDVHGDAPRRRRRQQITEPRHATRELPTLLDPPRLRQSPFVRRNATNPINITAYTRHKCARASRPAGATGGERRRRRRPWESTRGGLILATLPRQCTCTYGTTAGDVNAIEKAHTFVIPTLFLGPLRARYATTLHIVIMHHVGWRLYYSN